jgi:hypothetical protein
MYLTVLKADLEVIERRPHNMTVGYLPLGSDATVNWGTIDFKFRNNTDYPIRIETELSNNLELTVRLIGTKLDDTTIKITYTQINYTPIQVIEKEDDDMAPGERKVFTEGSAGYVVDTYKNYYDADDNLIETKLIGRSSYSVQDRIILISKAVEEEDEEPDDPENPDDPDNPDDPGNPVDPVDPENPDDPGTEPGDPTDPPPADPPPTDHPPTDPPPTDPPPEEPSTEELPLPEDEI